MYALTSPAIIGSSCSLSCVCHLRLCPAVTISDAARARATGKSVYFTFFRFVLQLVLRGPAIRWCILSVDILHELLKCCLHLFLLYVKCNDPCAEEYGQVNNCCVYNYHCSPYVCASTGNDFPPLQQLSMRMSYIRPDGIYVKS